MAYEQKSGVGSNQSDPTKKKVRYTKMLIKRNFPTGRSVYNGNGFVEPARGCLVKHLNQTDQRIRNINRAGIVPYSVIDGKLTMCFGVYNEEELTDFGGKRKSGEDSISCAIREHEEESRKVFGQLSKQDLQNFYCLHNSKMLIIFVPVVARKGEDIRVVTIENFRQKSLLTKKEVNNKKFNELTDMYWLEEEEIEETLIKNKSHIKFYHKVHSFIKSCPKFSKSIDNIKQELMFNWFHHQNQNHDQNHNHDHEQRWVSQFKKSNNNLILAY